MTHDVAAHAVDAGRVRINVYGVRHDLDIDTAHALIDALQAAIRDTARLTVGES